MRLAAVVAAVSTMTATGPAHAASTARFTATTWLNATALPQASATGDWTVDGTTAALHVNAVNAAPARTRVEASWTSPYARARGYCFGDFAFGYVNNGNTAPTPHATTRLRYRQQGGRWSRWFTEYDADYYYDPDPQYSMGGRHTDDCVFLFRSRPRRALQLEVRHVVEYVGTTRVTEDLRVSVP